MGTPETLEEAIVYFGSFENCKALLIRLRWPEGAVLCPQCQSTQVTWLESARLWKCNGKHPKAKFSLKTGTVFEDSPLGLEKWMTCVWLIANSKGSVSSWEIHRVLGVTQKTAWFLLHRVRLALHDSWNSDAMSGTADSGKRR